MGRARVRLRDFDALTFDCYGTLIDWESGIYAGLRPLLDRAGPSLSRDEVLEAFARRESAQEAATPALPYSELLAVVQCQLAEDWHVASDAAEAQAFGASVGDWPAFADSADALQYLQQHYKLVILSNVDRQSFQASAARLGVVFDAVYTAQDIGSYKPDARNFQYLLAQLGQRGIAANRILHTAQSLFHDHLPANAAGLATAWIDRRHDAPGWGATMPPAAQARIDFRFDSMADMVRAHQQAMADAA